MTTYYCAVTFDGLFLTMNGYKPALTTTKYNARILPDESKMRLEAELASKIVGEPLSVVSFS